MKGRLARLCRACGAERGHLAYRTFLTYRIALCDDCAKDIAAAELACEVRCVEREKAENVAAIRRYCVQR